MNDLIGELAYDCISVMRNLAGAYWKQGLDVSEWFACGIGYRSSDDRA